MKLSRKLVHNNAFTRSAVVLLSTLACTSLSAEEQDPAYTMTVIADAAAGGKITAGKYDVAIAKITAKRRSADPYSDQTNLCVAYTKSGDLEKATTACEAAITEVRAEKYVNRFSSLPQYGESQYRTYLALALSNRGVLHAVSGEVELAMESFREALDLEADLSAPRVNLARLGKAEAPAS